MAVVICREHKLNINAVSETIHLGLLPLIFVVLVCGRAEPRLGNCLCHENLLLDLVNRYLNGELELV